MYSLKVSTIVNKFKEDVSLFSANYLFEHHFDKDGNEIILMFDFFLSNLDIQYNVTHRPIFSSFLGLPAASHRILLRSNFKI